MFDFVVLVITGSVLLVVVAAEIYESWGDEKALGKNINYAGRIKSLKSLDGESWIPDQPDQRIIQSYFATFRGQCDVCDRIGEVITYSVDDESLTLCESCSVILE